MKIIIISKGIELVRSNYPSINKFEIFLYTVSVILCILFLVLVFHLWEADFRYPFASGGDYNGAAIRIKGMIDHGWVNKNEYLGMPEGFQMYDYPTSDFIFWILIKFFTVISNNWALIYNLVVFSAYIITVVTSLYVFRFFKISPEFAIVGSILFAFTPYHQNRMWEHVFLGFYFLVPLVFLIIFWILQKENFFEKTQNKFLVNLKYKPKFIFIVMVLFLVSSSGIYYAFFSCFFFLVSGLIVFLNDKNNSKLPLILLFIFIILVGIIINIFPNLNYSKNNGINSEVSIRTSAESEYYGLKIIQLLLPIRDHRIQIFNQLTEIYIHTAPLVNENQSSSLGLVGSCGFCLLIISLFHSRNDGFYSLIKNAGLLIISAILLGTVGGGGTLFSILVTPQIRGYNRISIFIAFLSIFAFILFFDQLIKKISLRFSIPNYLIGIIALVILIIGIFDQTSPSMMPNYEELKNNYNSNHLFVSEIEKKLPLGAMVFQLPYVPFPENPPVVRMIDYDHFMPYLHSSNLRWSYGAMKGRDGDLRIKNISSKPINEMLVEIINLGFSGIYIDKFGYDDNGKLLQSELEKLISEEPIIDKSGRYVFYNLQNYGVLNP